MKEQKNRDTLYSILIVAGVALVAFMVVKIYYLEAEKKQLIDFLSAMNQNIEGTDMLMNVDYTTFSFSDEVSVALGIITAGISVFAIFGGFLSVANLLQFKKMDKAIKMSEKAIEYQRELECANFIQDGRMYINRKRQKYAEDCFIRARRVSTPDSYMGLVAEYEILALYADTLPLSRENRDKIETEYKQLEKKLNESNSNDEPRNTLLKGDTYFLMGCVYGNYYLYDGKMGNLESSETYLKDAIKCDQGNADFYRNLAVTYALKGDKEKCKEYINKAKEAADLEQLYAGLVSEARLQLLFSPAWGNLNDQVKHMLKTEFGIVNGDQS